MNDSMSILLATTILALGGLGLYMYKSSDENQKGGNEEYDESSLFGENFWGFSDDKNVDDEKDDENLEEYLEEEYDYKPRKKNAKTQKNKKPTGSSRRRY